MKERKIPIAAARSQLANLLREVERGTRIQLTRYNRAVAALVSDGDLASLKDCEQRRVRRKARAVRA